VGVFDPPALAGRFGAGYELPGLHLEITLF
jgi:hypothetical protein